LPKQKKKKLLNGKEQRIKKEQTDNINFEKRLLDLVKIGL